MEKGEKRFGSGENKKDNIVSFSRYKEENKLKKIKKKMQKINEKSDIKLKIEKIQKINNNTKNAEEKLNGEKENCYIKRKNNQRNKRFEIKKINLLYLIIIFLAIFSVVAYAYMTARASKVNDIALGYNKIELIEDYTPPLKMEPGISFTKEPYVKNTGDVSCYVRIKSVVSDSRIAQYLTIKYGETEGYNTADFTYNESDGYWYYNKELAPGEQTEALFTAVTVSENADENVLEGFDIYVYAESVQAVEGETMEQAWKTN